MIRFSSLLYTQPASEEHMHDHEGTSNRKGAASSVAASSADSPTVSEAGLPPWASLNLDYHGDTSGWA